MKGKGGWEAAYTVRRRFRNVAIDVCLLFNFVVVFSSTNLRFRSVKTCV
jgi:hypothetical protein